MHSFRSSTLIPSAGPRSRLRGESDSAAQLTAQLRGQNGRQDGGLGRRQTFTTVLLRWQRVAASKLFCYVVLRNNCASLLYFF